jgi:electron transport complex protein RnfE
LHLFGDHYRGFLIAMLPPGAFILLGCMIAWKNWIDARAAARQQRQMPPPAAAIASN